MLNSIRKLIQNKSDITFTSWFQTKYFAFEKLPFENGVCHSFAVALASLLQPSNVEFVVLVAPVVGQLVCRFVLYVLFILSKVASVLHNQRRIESTLLLSPFTSGARVAVLRLGAFFSRLGVEVG